MPALIPAAVITRPASTTRARLTWQDGARLASRSIGTIPGGRASLLL